MIARRRWWAAALLLGTLATAPRARADEATPGGRGGRSRAARAQALRQRGLEHFVHRDYQRAADELMEAYRIDKREDTLFSWAEAVRATGDCPLASRIYQRLLARTTDLTLVRQAEYGIASCEGSDPATGAAVEIDDAAAAPTESAAAPPRVAAISDPPIAADVPSGPAIDHTTSYIVIGSGALTGLIGLALYATATDGTGIPNATHATITAARSSGDWQRLIGASIGVIGGGVTLYGVLRYRRDAPRRDPVLAVGPYVTLSGIGLAVSGRY
jgi:hypothetical protein